ncbi:MAG: 16S rRNA (cytosine(1402)-N(4))-methyltransferase RsmH [bacterium]
MHKPVLLREVIDLMQVREGGSYVDGTLGGGGHAEAILQQAGDRGRLFGMDRDEDAIARTRQRLAVFGSRCTLVHGNFSDMIALAQTHGFDPVDGVLLDLGMSSNQVDDAARGFSFLRDGPLDMRMDRSQGETAADVVNGLAAEDLADLLWRLGEESASRRIARMIVEERASGPIRTTAHLADVVSRAKGGRHGRIHPATQTFQALRMAVNREMEAVEQGVEAAVRLVKQNSRVAVITFHSVEDRLVKQIFARHEGMWESLQAGGRAWRGEQPAVRRVNRKPVVATDEEREENPRARSAKLRVVERI